MTEIKPLEASTKEEQWQQTIAKFLRIRDGLGMPIDEGILETVVVLNLLGLRTDSSCEGHLERASGGPWVMFEAEGTEEMDRQMHKNFDKIDEIRGRGEESKEMKETISSLYEEIDQIVKKLRPIHIQSWRKLMEYLDMFYQGRKVPYDRRLVIQTLYSGTGRLENMGSDLQDTVPPETRKQKLQEYQEEMQAFTAFLKERYFSSNTVS